MSKEISIECFFPLPDVVCDRQTQTTNPDIEVKLVPMFVEGRDVLGN